MDLGGLADKAKKALGDEKTSDSVLEKGEKLVDDRTGNKYDAQTDKAGDFADEHLGRRD